jgi:hypothetical protein
MKLITPFRLAGALFCGGVLFTAIAPWWAYPTQSSAVVKAADPIPDNPKPTSRVSEPPSVDALNSVKFRAFIEKFKRGSLNAEDIEGFKNWLTQEDPDWAIPEILGFIKSRLDAPTGASFEVGARGELGQAPTLRVLLMDILGLLARGAKREEAAVLARSIMSSKSSPDEWAICMRNLAWTDPESGAYLNMKFKEMLQFPSWINNPQPALLECFDFPVYTKDARWSSDLSGYLNSENEFLKKAATLALNRLTEAASDGVMSYLNLNPELLAENPPVRASLFAKADLANPAQLRLIEAYLHRDDVEPAEKEAFFNGLATPTYYVCNGLFDPAIENLSPTGTPIDSRDTLLRRVYGEWLRDDRFPKLREPLSAALDWLEK